MLGQSGGDPYLLGIAAIVASLFSGAAMVLSGLNRRDLRTPRKRRSRDATEKALPSVGIGEAVAGMREELSTGLASIGGRLDVHEALPSENAHGKRH